MRPISFRGFASEISAGRLDGVDPDVRERAVNQTLKRNSWFELAGSLVVIVATVVFGVAFGRAIAGGYRTPSPLSISCLSLALTAVVLSERKGRDRVKREFIGRYGDETKQA
jgi:hypothetical protein